MKTKYVVFFISAFLVMLFVDSCSKSNTSYTAPAGGGGTTTSTINIKGMAFPSSITVAKGVTVTWYNQDATTHTVTSDDGTAFNSGNVPAGTSFSYMANTAGTFAYHCNIHSNMHGTLIVTP